MKKACFFLIAVLIRGVVSQQLCMQDSMYNPDAQADSSGSTCEESASQWAYDDLSSHCLNNGGVMAAFAAKCCDDGTSICPVSQLCMDNSAYTPDEKAVGENTCAQLAHQWAYSDKENQCEVNGNDMASFASICCSDGISVCPVSQLCLDDSKYSPTKIAYGESTCGDLAYQWAYNDKDFQCEKDEALMSYFSNLCCLDGLSVCPASQLCETESKYLPYADFDPNQKCHQLSPRWSYTDVETKCLYDEGEMVLYADACCTDGMSVCPVSQLCKDDSQYNPRAIIAQGQSCNQQSPQWKYTDLEKQCDSLYEKEIMAKYALSCCGDFESNCGFFQICEDPEKFNPETPIDTKNYGSGSGVKRCAEIAAALSSEYLTQDDYCADGSTPDLSSSNFDFYHVFAYECCSDKISVCAEYISVDVTITLSASALPSDADKKSIKTEIAETLGVESTELEGYTVSSDDKASPYMWTVTFSLPKPIPSLGSADDVTASVKNKLEDPTFDAALQDNVGVKVESISTDSSAIKDGPPEASKEISTLGLLIILGVIAFVLLCATITWMLPSRNAPPAPPQSASSLPQASRQGDQGVAQKSKSSKANGAKTDAKKQPQRPVHTEKNTPGKIDGMIAEEERKLNDV